MEGDSLEINGETINTSEGLTYKKIVPLNEANEPYSVKLIRFDEKEFISTVYLPNDFEMIFPQNGKSFKPEDEIETSWTGRNEGAGDRMEISLRRDFPETTYEIPDFDNKRVGLFQFSDGRHRLDSSMTVPQPHVVGTFFY